MRSQQFLFLFVSFDTRRTYFYRNRFILTNEMLVTGYVPETVTYCATKQYTHVS